MTRFFFLVLCLLLRPCAALTLYSEINEPFNFIEQTRGKIAGISVDLLTEAARRANVPLSILITVPWARAQELVKRTDQTDACLFSFTRTAEREPFYQWVGPLARSKWALFARDDFTGQLKTLVDARPYTIGGYLNDSRTAFVEKMGGFKLDIVYDDMLNPKKLAAGRIDLWISSLYGGRQMAATVGVSGIKPVLVFNEVDNYLACGPKVPMATVAVLQQALDEMRRDGTSKRITDSYLRNY